jgi:hypothetical protein
MDEHNPTDNPKKGVSLRKAGQQRPTDVPAVSLAKARTADPAVTQRNSSTTGSIGPAATQPIEVRARSRSGTAIRRDWRGTSAIVIPILLLVLIVAVAGAAYLIGHEKAPVSVANAPSGTTGAPLASNAGPTTPSGLPESPSSTVPTAPPETSTAASPAQALTLTTTQALSQLKSQSRDSLSVIGGLRGYWAPQVSSKCVGVAVDIEPHWLPDGNPDVGSITIQQILAFNLSMTAHFGAVTTMPTAVGIDFDRPTSGACEGEVTWMSLVPVRFSTAAQANDWCQSQGLPHGECEARFVAPMGGRSTAVLPQP